MLPVEPPFKVYPDLDGKPLDAGFIFFGQPNQNPETAPVTVYWDAEGTQPAAQPLRTLNGYIARAGTAANVYVDGEYSQTVRDVNEVLVFHSRTSADFSITSFVQAYSDALLARLAQSDGAALLGFDDSTVDKKLRQTVSIQDLGGKDDFGSTSTTDNALAYAQITSKYPPGTTIRFPKTLTGQYDFASYAGGNYNDYIWDVDEGVVLRFPINAMIGQPLARVVRDTDLYFKDLNTRYTLKASFSNTGQHRFHLRKSQFMGPGDRDTTVPSVVDLTAAGVEKFDCAWPDGPFTVSDSIATTARKADISLAAGNAAFKAIALPCQPGAEYQCWFDCPAGWDGFYFFGVATQNGYDVLYESMIPGTGASRMIKEFGAAAENYGIPYMGSGDTYSTWAKNGECTVRCLSHNSFVVLVNGVERYRSRATRSPIRSILMGAGFGSMAATISVRDVVMLKNKQTAGQKPLKILALGDSITDAQIHGNWPNYMAEALEGTMGIRVRQMFNIAVSGAKAVDQYATLLTANISDINVAVILIGVNDIQAQTDPDASFVFNLGRMLDHLNNAGIPCVVGLPTMFFSRALAATATGFETQGVDSMNYEKGGGYRGRLIYEVAKRNAGATAGMNTLCFGTLEELGPVLASALVDIEGLDPIVFDNIHHTSHGRRLIGYTAARSVAGLLAPLVTRAYPRTSFRPEWMLGGWAPNTASFDISEAGEVSLPGLINKSAGAIADATEVFQLPPFLRPHASIQMPCLVTGAALNAVARVLIDSATGKGTIYGVPAGTTGIYLDSIRYRLNW